MLEVLESECNETAGTELSAAACESFFGPAFDVWDRLPDVLKLNNSSMDLCLIFFASLQLLLSLDLGILTGEPLMLTKTLVLLTDLFIGGLTEETMLEIALLGRPEGNGELRDSAGGEGVERFLGDEMWLDEEVVVTAAVGW